MLQFPQKVYLHSVTIVLCMTEAFAIDWEKYNHIDTCACNFSSKLQVHEQGHHSQPGGFKIDGLQAVYIGQHHFEELFQELTSLASGALERDARDPGTALPGPKIWKGDQACPWSGSLSTVE